MRLSDINPVTTLKTVLTEKGVTETIYTGNKPTSGLPNEYVDLFQNGGMSTNLSRMGMVEGYVLIGITVKLLSTGGRNTAKESFILKKIDTLFEDNSIVEKDGFVFRIEPGNMVYDGGGIYEGYTTKLINITFEYYGNN